MDMCKNKKSLSNRLPACSTPEQLSLFCLENNPSSSNAPRGCTVLCSEATKQQAPSSAGRGLADTKLWASLLICGVHSPACQHYSRALNPDILPFSSAASPFKTSYQTVKNPPANAGALGSLGWEGPLEQSMATHSSILAWSIPWTEEPSGLPSTGSQGVIGLSNSKEAVTVENLTSLLHKARTAFRIAANHGAPPSLFYLLDCWQEISSKWPLKCREPRGG